MPIGKPRHGRLLSIHFEKRTGARRSSGTGGIQDDRVPGARNVESVTQAYNKLAYNKLDATLRERFCTFSIVVRG